MDSFPIRCVRRGVQRDPIVVACVRLMELLIEGGSIVGGGMRHLADRYVGAIGRMPMLEVDSMALFGQVSGSHEQ